MFFYGAFILVSKSNPSRIMLLERIDVLGSCFTPVFIDPIFELDNSQVPNFEGKRIIDKDILLQLLLHITIALRQSTRKLNRT